MESVVNLLKELWLPIVLSGVIVWVASFLIWMISPMHKGEWKPLPDENGFMGAMTEMGVQPGQYMFPCPTDRSDMNSPEFQEKVKRGPNGIITVWPGPTNMGRNMFLCLVIYWIVSIFVAYLGWHCLQGSDPYLHKFRITGTAAVMAYCFASLPHDIWFGKPGKSMLTGLIDGVIYGLLTAGTFAWLWPKGMV